MSIISSLPYSLTNGTTADATQVMADFNQIYNNVNANAAPQSNPTISGGTIDNTIIGGTTPASGSFTSLNATSIGNSLKQAILAAMYPVGSLYYNASVSTNPGTLLGFGTWTAFAAGQIPIGVGSFTDGDGNSETITAGQQLGEYLHTLTTTEMPSHNHPDSGHTHGMNLVATYNTSGGSNGVNGPGGSPTGTGYANIQNTGGGGAHNNIQPSIGVYIWQRTA